MFHNLCIDETNFKNTREDGVVEMGGKANFSFCSFASV